jgi:hypothetical protein
MGTKQPECEADPCLPVSDSWHNIGSKTTSLNNFFLGFLSPSRQISVHSHLTTRRYNRRLMTTIYTAILIFTYLQFVHDYISVDTSSDRPQ